MPTKLEPADVAHFTQAQRRAVLGALCTAVFADGTSDPRKAGALRASLDASVWGVSGAEILGDFVEAQRESARRSRPELVALGQTCALACPTLALREKLLTMMLEIAWLDSVFKPEEQHVIEAFAQGLGVPRERLAALVAPAAAPAPAASANDSNLFPAVASGRLDDVRRMLDAGTSVMSRDPRQWTPLHVAVATGREAIVELLLARGADVNAVHSQGSPPLLLACNKPFAAIVSRLLAAGAQPDARVANGLVALHVAALTGQTAVARALRAGGAALDLADLSGETPLHVAANRRHGELVAFLLAEGAAVDARTKLGCTPLHHASTSGDLVAVGALLAAKADLHAADVDGQTPLHFAACYNHPELVSLFLALGARVDARTNKGVTALHLAAIPGYSTCVTRLLEAGAAVDARNVEGGTPLFGAVIHARREVCALLRKHGASDDTATQFGTTPRTVGAVAIRIALRSVPISAWPPFVSPVEAIRNVVPLGAAEAEALSRFDDYQIPAWLNAEGAAEPVYVSGTDAKGRPQYVSAQRGGADEPRARLLCVTDPDGMRWLPVLTSEAAAQAFRARVQLTWPEHGAGLAQAVLGSASGAVFQIADLPVDGVVLDPCGPGAPRTLSLEQCERVARYRRG